MNINDIMKNVASQYMIRYHLVNIYICTASVMFIVALIVVIIRLFIVENHREIADRMTEITIYLGFGYVVASLLVIVGVYIFDSVNNGSYNSKLVSVIENQYGLSVSDDNILTDNNISALAYNGTLGPINVSDKDNIYTVYIVNLNGEYKLCTGYSDGANPQHFEPVDTTDYTYTPANTNNR